MARRTSRPPVPKSKMLATRAPNEVESGRHERHRREASRMTDPARITGPIRARGEGGRPPHAPLPPLRGGEVEGEAERNHREDVGRSVIRLAKEAEQGLCRRMSRMDAWHDAAVEGEDAHTQQGQKLVPDESGLLVRSRGGLGHAEIEDK